MPRIGLALSLLAAYLLGPLPSVASEASPAPACVGGSCSADEAVSSMIQIKGRMQQPASSVVIAGVPVYNYDKLQPTQTLPGGTLEYNWVFAFKLGTTDAQVGAFCAAAARCTGQGNPDRGGVPMAFVQGSEELMQSLVAQYNAMLRYAEPDAYSAPVPEVGLEPVPPPRLGAVASWGLDRIDSRSGLDGVYRTSANGGRGVHVYVTDTGIRTTHVDFRGVGGTSRAIPTLEVLVAGLWECGGDPNCALDRNGHGTHCAGIIGGQTFGVAKAVTLHAVKTFPDTGTGPFSYWVRALDWIVTSGQRPAVVSASMGGPGTWSFVRDAVDSTTNAGISVVVAAGNSNMDACGFQPAFVPSAITVGATNIQDDRAWFSDYGTCLDLFAPGVDITSDGIASDTSAARMSGTSMACPHVAGAAALLLQADASLSPAQLAGRLGADATRGVLSNVGPGSPNSLLYVPPPAA